MFTNMFTDPYDLNKIIDKLVAALSQEKEGTKEYSAILDQLTKLYALKKIDIDILLKIDEADDKQRETELKCEGIEIENDQKRNEKMILGLKPETLALIAANLVGIGLILGHERLGVVTSKAIGFVSKLR